MCFYVPYMWRNVQFMCKLLERTYLRMQDKLSKLTIILYRIDHIVSYVMGAFIYTSSVKVETVLILSDISVFFVFVCARVTVFLRAELIWNKVMSHVFMNHSGVSNIGIKIWWYGNFVDLCCETSIRSSMRLFLRSILCKNVLTYSILFDLAYPMVYKMLYRCLLKTKLILL